MSDGISPAHWTEIPSVPVDLFKELDLGCFDLTQPHLRFHTSGTTQGRPGVHHLRDAAFYERSAQLHFRRRLAQAPGRIVSLCPPEGGTSSLGHMVALFGTVQHGFDPAQGVRPEAWSWMDAPVFLAATAFALDAFFALEGAVNLGSESLVMVTGGFKGRKVRLDAPSLYEAIGARLGKPRVVGEYGMTELSSQLWTLPVEGGQIPGRFFAPHWLGVYAADPFTGLPLPDGTEGVLRFVDLANVWSVVAIETLDLGVVHTEGGEQSVELRGRLAGAEARGCSLRMEELWERSGRA